MSEQQRAVPGRAAPGAPWGHSASAHLHLGFCSHCPEQNAAAEAVAWRVWAAAADQAEPYQRGRAEATEAIVAVLAERVKIYPPQVFPPDSPSTDAIAGTSMRHAYEQATALAGQVGAVYAQDLGPEALGAVLDAARKGGRLAGLAALYNPATENYTVGRIPSLRVLVELQPKLIGQWDVLAIGYDDQEGPETWVTDRWGYPSYEKALAGAEGWLAGWLAGGAPAEPPGWHRHWASHRKRAGGDPEREYRDGEFPPG